MTTSKVKVLAVCTGNICRSPAVERLLEARIGDAVDASSAGINAVVDHPISPDMAVLIEKAGADTQGFAARQVNERLLKEADLILALTQRHRAEVLALFPLAFRRCFTLLEFEAILTSPGFPPLRGSDAERLRLAVMESGKRRSTTPEGPRDVPDPYGRSRRDYEESFGLIDRSLNSVLRAIRS